MSNMKEVTQDEFEAFLAAYPRKLERNVTTICEPPMINFNDFERAPYWPDSVVASYSMESGYEPGTGPSGWRVLADINSAVEDDGERDTDEPLFDSNGVELHEGDQVVATWGFGPPNTTMFNSTYGSDGIHRKTETILIRDKGTKYEHWSFESCHNLVRGFEMVKVAQGMETGTAETPAAPGEA